MHGESLGHAIVGVRDHDGAAERRSGSRRGASFAHRDSDMHILAMRADPHFLLRDEVLQRVILGRGTTDPALRAAAADGTGLPPDLQPLTDKIHAHAYLVTDEDLARLGSVYDEDQLFEIIVSAALGAARHRLMTGLLALEQA